uniref:Uncharacterized protein n=1 Tax=Anguilla anguilla TaxID=7936 RepID=A0A0E9V644_ANGAN
MLLKPGLEMNILYIPLQLIKKGAMILSTKGFDQVQLQTMAQ